MNIIDRIFNYDNIGGKIKTLAKWGFYVEAIGAMISGIVMIFEEAFLAGLVTLLLGPVVAWVASWLLYAFGELAEDTHALRYNSHIPNIDRNLHILAAPVVQEAEEKARREAEKLAQQKAEERAKWQAEVRAKQEAAELAKREEQERRKRDVEELTARVAKSREKPGTSASTPREITLADRLAYALQFQTDDGMISYLKGIDDQRIQEVLKLPQHRVREEIEFLLKNL